MAIWKAISRNGQHCHDDVTIRKHFLRCWPFVRWPVNSPHTVQWRAAFMFSLIRAWTNSWVNKCDAVNLGRHRAHYDVTVMVPAAVPQYPQTLWRPSSGPARHRVEISNWLYILTEFYNKYRPWVHLSGAFLSYMSDPWFTLLIGVVDVL